MPAQKKKRHGKPRTEPPSLTAMQEAVRKRRTEQENTVHTVGTDTTVDTVDTASNVGDVHGADTVDTVDTASNVGTAHNVDNADNVDNVDSEARNTGASAGVVDDGAGEHEDWFHRHFGWMFGDK